MKYITIFILKIRWWYFHINPRYVGFKVTEDSDTLFQHVKRGTIHCNYKWVD